MANDLVLGASEQVQAADYTPALSGMGPEKTIVVYNPMPYAFRVRFAREQASRPTNTPELESARRVGLNLEKLAPKDYVIQEVVLPALTNKNLPGDIAQKAVRDLITAVIQYREEDGSYNIERGSSRKNFVPDPTLRRQVEQEIIKQIYDTTEFFNMRGTPQQQTDQEIGRLNDIPDPAPGTGVNYTPKKTVPAGPENQDTSQPEATEQPETDSKK